MRAGVKLPAHSAGLPGNVPIITRSALTPLRESVSALPAYQAGHPADLPVNASSSGTHHSVNDEKIDQQK